MTRHLLLAALFVLSVACRPNDVTTNANQTNNSNSAIESSGKAGKASSPTPSPSPSPSKPEAGKTVQVRFPAGATEASYTDSFSGYDYIDYVFDARADQNLTAEITRSDSNKAILTVMRNGDAVETDASMVQGWTGILPATGRYTVRVGQMRDDARSGGPPVKFSILIRIVN